MGAFSSFSEEGGEMHGSSSASSVASSNRSAIGASSTATATNHGSTDSGFGVGFDDRDKKLEGIIKGAQQSLQAHTNELRVAENDDSRRAMSASPLVWNTTSRSTSPLALSTVVLRVPQSLITPPPSIAGASTQTVAPEAPSPSHLHIVTATATTTTTTTAAASDTSTAATTATATAMTVEPATENNSGFSTYYPATPRAITGLTDGPHSQAQAQAVEQASPKVEAQLQLQAAQTPKKSLFSLSPPGCTQS
jgi:hypothetical protein